MSEAFSHLRNQRTENSTNLVLDDGSVNHEDSDQGTKDGDQGNGEGNVTMSAEVLGHSQKKNKEQMTPDEHRTEMHAVSAEKHAAAHSRKKSNHPPVSHSVHLVKYDFLPQQDDQAEMEVSDELVEEVTVEKISFTKDAPKEKTVFEKEPTVEKFLKEESVLEDIDNIVAMYPKNAPVTKDAAPELIIKVTKQESDNPSAYVENLDNKVSAQSEEKIDKNKPEIEKSVIVKTTINQPKKEAAQNNDIIVNVVAPEIKATIEHALIVSAPKQVASQSDTPKLKTENVSEPIVTIKDTIGNIDQKIDLNTIPVIGELNSEQDAIFAVDIKDNTQKVNVKSEQTFVPAETSVTVTETAFETPQKELVSKPIIVEAVVQSQSEQNIIAPAAIINKVIADQPAPEMVSKNQSNAVKTVALAEPTKDQTEISIPDNQLEAITVTSVAATKDIIINDTPVSEFTASVTEIIVKNQLNDVNVVSVPALPKSETETEFLNTQQTELSQEAPNVLSSLPAISVSENDNDANYSVAEIKEFWDKNVKQITTKLKVVELQPQRNLQAVHTAPQEQLDNITADTINDSKTIFKTKMQLLSDNEDGLGIAIANNKIEDKNLQNAYLESQFCIVVPGSEKLVPATRHDNTADYWDLIQPKYNSPEPEYGMTG